VAFIFAVRVLAKPFHFVVNCPTTLRENKDGYISLLSILNAITGTSYCVILKMVILHDAIKTIQNVIFVFFVKKEQKPV